MASSVKQQFGFSQGEFMNGLVIFVGLLTSENFTWSENKIRSVFPAWLHVNHFSLITIMGRHSQ